MISSSVDVWYRAEEERVLPADWYAAGPRAGVGYAHEDRGGTGPEAQAVEQLTQGQKGLVSD